MHCVFYKTEYIQKTKRIEISYHNNISVGSMHVQTIRQLPQTTHHFLREGVMGLIDGWPGESY